MLRRLLCLILALATFGLAACTAPPESSSLELPTALPSSGQQNTEPERAAGGSLRLWWPVRTSLNPLHETSRAGQAAYDLIYEGLFKVNSDDSLSFGLAQRIMAFEDDRQILIAVQEGRKFHDGRPVTNTDVVACLDYLLQTEHSTSWSWGLEQIASVAALGENVVEIRLHEADPWLAWSLVFPIIPADQVEKTDFSIPAGTGPYQIKTYDPELGTELVAIGREGADLPAILLKEYANQQKAMQALENDQLDLVLLGTELYSSYQLRSSLRLDYFAADEVFFLAYNSQPGRLLAGQAELASLKEQLAAFRSNNDVFSSWAQSSAYAAVKTSVFWPGQLEQRPGPAGGLAGAELKLLVSAQDKRRQKLAEQIAALLQDLAIDCSVKELAAEELAQALAAGDYDLALLAARLPQRPALDFLIKQPPDPAFSGLDLIRPDGTGLAGLADWQQELNKRWPWQKLYPALSFTSDPDWLRAVVELTNRSAWDILCLPYAGLVYGDRVRGQCQPDRYHPYKDIKELWLWSTQS